MSLAETKKQHKPIQLDDDDDICQYCGKECGATCDEGMIHADLLHDYVNVAAIYKFTEHHKKLIAELVKQEYGIGALRFPEFIEKLESILNKQ